MTTDNIDQTPSREEQIAANKARRAAAAANQKANYKPKNGHVDFRAVHDASLNSLDAVLQRYLPEGRRKGKEWIARNPTRADGHLGSFSVNRRTGVWSDFATGAKGGDPIDLVAYLTGSPSPRRLLRHLVPMRHSL